MSRIRTPITLRIPISLVLRSVMNAAKPYNPKGVVSFCGISCTSP